MSQGSWALLCVHLALTAAMAGVIWIVQLVHYPLMAQVGAESFTAYELAHTRRISWVVVPLMGLETVAAIALVITGVPGHGRVLPIAGLLILLGIHASTALVQSPAHATLCRAYDPWVLARLVRTNWLRTAGWSVRTGLALAMLLAAR